MTVMEGVVVETFNFLLQNDAIGTSRQFVATQQFGRFRSEAEMDECATQPETDVNEVKAAI